MDLSKELPEAISLNWDEEEWIQPIDYEQLPFQCKQCHEYGHFGRNFPKTVQSHPIPSQRQGGELDGKGFTQVENKRRSRVGGPTKP